MSTGKSSTQFVRALGSHLTPRQLAVLELVVAGLSNKQVAADLGISEGTVELHMTAILKKSRTESRAALLAKYFTQTSGSKPKRVDPF